jgi:arabinofuranosyltransferase
MIFKKILKLVIAVIIFEVFLILCGKLNFIQDDAYISLQYAKNFVQGNGLVFNAGEKVEGFTSFIWVIILAIPFYFHISPEVFAKVLSITFGVLSLLPAYLITKNLIQKIWPASCDTRFIYFTPVVLLVISGTFYYWAVSGMETTLYTFLCLAGIYFYLIRNEKEIYLYLAVSFLTLAFLTRQEAALIICIILINLLRDNFKDGNYKTGKNLFPKKLIVSFLILAVPAVIFFAFRYFYYGYFFPNTFYAKTGSSLVYMETGFNYTISFANRYLLYGSLLVLPLLLFRIEKLKNTLALLYEIIIIWFIYVILVGGDVLAMHRFFIPILPLIYVVFTTFLFYIYKLTEAALKNNILRGIIFILIIFIVGVNIHLNNFRNAVDTSRKERNLIFKMELIAKAIKHENGTGSKKLLIAATTIGALKYFSGCRVLDMLGLTDRFIAHNPSPIKFISELKTGWKERNYNAQYVLSRKPDYIIFSTNEKPSSFAERALFIQPGFLKDYLVYPLFVDSSGIAEDVYKRRSEENINLRSSLKQNNKDYSPTFVNLYNLFLNQLSREQEDNQLEKINIEFNNLIKISPSYFSEPYRFMAVFYYNKKDYLKAMQFSNKCIEIDSSNLYSRLILYRISKSENLKTIAARQKNYFKNRYPELYDKID